eukprot:5017373-Pyramimonas_sp.AAC.1
MDPASLRGRRGENLSRRPSTARRVLGPTHSRNPDTHLQAPSIPVGSSVQTKTITAPAPTRSAPN